MFRIEKIHKDLEALQELKIAILENTSKQDIISNFSNVIVVDTLRTVFQQYQQTKKTDLVDELITLAQEIINKHQMLQDVNDQGTKRGINIIIESKCKKFSKHIQSPTFLSKAISYAVGCGNFFLGLYYRIVELFMFLRNKIFFKDDGKAAQDYDRLIARFTKLQLEEKKLLGGNKIRLRRDIAIKNGEIYVNNPVVWGALSYGLELYRDLEQLKELVYQNATQIVQSKSITGPYKRKLNNIIAQLHDQVMACSDSFYIDTIAKEFGPQQGYFYGFYPSEFEVADTSMTDCTEKFDFTPSKDNSSCDERPRNLKKSKFDIERDKFKSILEQLIEHSAKKVEVHHQHNLKDSIRFSVKVEYWYEKNGKSMLLNFSGGPDFISASCGVAVRDPLKASR